MELINPDNYQPKEGEMVLYRYESDIWGSGLSLHKYKVTKETPCGYWILLYDGFTDKKWVGKTTTKRFAYTTTEDALVGFICRKKRQIKILKAKLTTAKTLLDVAEKMIEKS